MTKDWLVREIASINDSRMAEEMLWRGRFIAMEKRDHVSDLPHRRAQLR